MTVTVNESGMCFGPFPKERCFEIEKRAAYKAIEAGVKVAEFVWLRDDKTPLSGETIVHALRTQLSWTHFRELLAIDDPCSHPKRTTMRPTP